MTTVRRLYFYVMVLISIEVVIWGVVGLLRTIFSTGFVGGNSLLATGLSLVLVGMPIFWLHWRAVQRDAANDSTERSSRIRAIFFYAALSVFFGPIVFAILALLNRGLVSLFGLTPESAWFGPSQSAIDNLLAILVNGVILFYFWRILRSDWLAESPENFLPETRRLYRYLWLLIGLTITVGGVYNLIRYTLDVVGQNPLQSVPVLAGGIAFLLVGTPLWGWHWWVIQESQSNPAERRSLLRLVVLYIISLAGVIGVLTSIGAILTSLLSYITGQSPSFQNFIQDNSVSMGAAIPLAVMWAYYGRILTKQMSGFSDMFRRSALRRLYYYVLSVLGLAVTFTGMLNLLDVIADMFFSKAYGFSSYRDPLSGAIAALLVGMPLWFVAWNEMQEEAAQTDDPGDHARRSILRKSYLYLVIFLLVVGAMAFSGNFLFTLLNSVLSQQIPTDLGQNLLNIFLWLILDLVFLVYHLQSLRRDNQTAQETLGELHSVFPTLIINEEDGYLNEVFIQEINRIAPLLPVALHQIEQGAPDESMLGTKAVLMSTGLALEPPESLQLWLSEFHGMRLLVPLKKEGWMWLGQSEKNPQELAREAARAVRQMAEGETLRQTMPSNPWAVTGYVLGAIFGLLLMVTLFSLMISVFFR